MPAGHQRCLFQLPLLALGAKSSALTFLTVPLVGSSTGFEFFFNNTCKHDTNGMQHLCTAVSALQEQSSLSSEMYIKSI